MALYYVGGLCTKNLWAWSPLERVMSLIEPYLVVAQILCSLGLGSGIGVSFGIRIGLKAYGS